MTKNLVISPALSVRKGAGIQEPIAGHLRQNESVEILEISTDQQWKKIQTSNGLTGWCASKYLVPVNNVESQIPQQVSASNPYTVITRGLVVRNGPNGTDVILGYLTEGEIVQALDHSADRKWVKIRKKDGLSGWSASLYLKQVTSTEPKPAVSKQTGMQTLEDRGNPRAGQEAVNPRIEIQIEEKTEARAVLDPQSYRERIQETLIELGINPQVPERMGLTVYEEATRLVSIGVDIGGRGQRLTPEAAKGWKAMKEAAWLEGVELLVLSAFRSVETQKALIQNNLNKGMNIAAALKLNTPPGYSEHHTGRALDLLTSGIPAFAVSFEKSLGFKWLRKNAGQYGFRLSYPRDNPQGMNYEPWHWCFMG